MSDMPEEIWATDTRFHDCALPLWHKQPTGTCGNYLLKSTVDAERAADSKTIRELAAALGMYAQDKLYEPTCIVTSARAKQVITDNAAQIAKAQGVMDENP